MEQTLIWSALGSPLLSNEGVLDKPRRLPDYSSGASSERRPLLCTGDPCASPLQQQVTELPKSQEVKS
jgi:hypothetical protein